jgi:hypothetical protein
VCSNVVLSLFSYTSPSMYFLIELDTYFHANYCIPGGNEVFLMKAGNHNVLFLTSLSGITAFLSSLPVFRCFF